MNKNDQLLAQINDAMKDMMDSNHRLLLLDCRAAIIALLNKNEELRLERNEARIEVCMLAPFCATPDHIDHDAVCEYAKSRLWNCIEPWDFPDE